ncbi:MAG: MOSC domain-containing protein [Acidimicrobiia bacterium]|nr:MOSC domain-containing protein [Acidimicrobiia bacterium]
MHKTLEQLQESTDLVKGAPADGGTLEMIVIRPDVGERVVLEAAELHRDHGVVGDSWRKRGSGRTEDGSAHPDMQLNLIGSRVLDLIAGGRDRWQLAGDQLYVDVDLSEENLPPWTRLSIGEAVIQVTDQPHTGCGKFSSRFGADALRWVNSPEGRALRLRGANARVVEPGTIRVGDSLTRLS